MAGLHNNIIKFPRETMSVVEAAAAAWLGRVTSGSLTLGELAEFEFWRTASPDHDRIYGEMEAMWQRLGNRAVAQDALRSVPDGSRRPDAFFGWVTRLGRFAAAIALMVVASQYLSSWRYDYDTGPGEIRRLVLADGSNVWMKGGTALNVHVSRTGARTVELAKGEAFFEVQHDATRPFTVAVGNGSVRDIGTRFSVARSGHSVSVAVEDGEVAVAGGGASKALVAGEQVSFDLYAMGRKQPVETGVISTWRRGIYVADSKPLGEVLSDLDEYHSGHIIVASHALAVRRVNAVVQLAHIDRLLDSLGQSPGISVRRWGPLTIVSERPT